MNFARSGPPSDADSEAIGWASYFTPAVGCKSAAPIDAGGRSVAPAIQVLNWFHSLFGLFLSAWGAFVLSFLDSTVLFVIPFGNDALIVYLVARNHELMWLYPLLMTAGSLLGAASTYWIGHKLGEKELPRFVSGKHLDRLKKRVSNAGAGTLALAAVLPPPFPLTPFVLTCGALEVNRRRFFALFGLMRLVRFGVEAVLADRYGRGVLRFLHSTTFEVVVGVLIVAAFGGTIVSGVVLWRRTRRR